MASRSFLEEEKSLDAEEYRLIGDTGKSRDLLTSYEFLFAIRYE